MSEPAICADLPVICARAINCSGNNARLDIQRYGFESQAGLRVTPAGKDLACIAPSNSAFSLSSFWLIIASQSQLTMQALRVRSQL